MSWDPIRWGDRDLLKTAPARSHRGRAVVERAEPLLACGRGSSDAGWPRRIGSLLFDHDSLRREQTPVIEYYGEIKLLHIACLLLSVSLFALRGLLTLTGMSFANHRGLTRLSYVIDTALLAAAIILTIIIHQYPFIQPWLTVKVLLLVVYIALGVFALRRGKTRLSKAGFFAAALCVYAFIISVAVTHNPRGFFSRRAASAPTSLRRELAWPALNLDQPSRS